MVWRLEKRKAPIRTCENCGRDFRKWSWNCPYCNHNSRAADGLWKLRLRKKEGNRCNSSKKDRVAYNGI